MYHIAVIGGNGFLGRSIIHRLSTHENLRIFSLDNRTHKVALNTKGYKAIVQQYVMDVSSESAITAWLMGHPVDAIIFAAGFESPTSGLGYTYKEETKALLALENTLAAMELMNLEAEESRPYFLYISSWSVYGSQKKIATEEAKEFPGNYNGMLKLVAEDLVKRCCTKQGSPFCIVRPSEVYGRREAKELQDPKFWRGYLSYYVDQAVRRFETIEIFSPKTKVDLIHINYFTKVISEILQQGLTGTYNICSGKTISVEHLVDEILYSYDQISGSDYLPLIKHKDKPAIEDMNLSADKAVIPYDFEKYQLGTFLQDYLKIRKLEVAKGLAIESLLSEPVILDPSADGAKEAFVARQVQRKISYGRIKKIAGDEFFKLGNVGNIVRRTEELDKLEFNSSLSLESQGNNDKLDLLNEEPVIKKRKKKKK